MLQSCVTRQDTAVLVARCWNFGGVRLTHLELPGSLSRQVTGRGSPHTLVEVRGGLFSPFLQVLWQPEGPKFTRANSDQLVQDFLSFSEKSKDTEPNSEHEGR